MKIFLHSKNMHYAHYIIGGFSNVGDFKNAWNEAKAQYGKDTWQFNKYIWENWYCQCTGGNPDLGGYIKALDAQAETFIKGRVDFGEGNIFSRNTLIYFTQSEVTNYWNVNISDFYFTRDINNQTNEQNIFTTQQNTSLGGGNLEGGSATAVEGDGYTSEYTSSKTKRTFREYKQYLGSYKDDKIYNGSKPISSSGCMVTAVAIALSGYDTNMSPGDVNRMGHDGVYSGTLATICDQYGIKYNTENANASNIDINELKEHLENGGVVVFDVGAGYFTHSTHYMTILDIRTNGGKDEIYISNPGDDSEWLEINRMNDSDINLAGYAYIYNK